VTFANPVPGIIAAQGTPAAPGQFRVTRTCQDHRNTSQGCALDLWNGRRGDPVTVMQSGLVIYRYDPEGIVRVLHGDDERTDYAHMEGIMVAERQAVRQGQQIGVVSDVHSASITNFSGPHLHTALVQRIAGVWVEVDLWPHLNQEESMKVKGAVIGQPTGTATVTASPVGNLMAGPTFAGGQRVAEYPNGIPTGVEFATAFEVLGDAPAGRSRKWLFGYYHDTTAMQIVYGYLHEDELGSITSSGVDCADEVQAATAPLNAEITSLTQQLGVANTRIAGAKTALG
jgi:hypothetical protein